MKNESEKLGTMPIGKLIFRMSIPAIISMLVQALYNVIDTVFVGAFTAGDSGLEALSIVFPLQMFQLAFALGVGVGANSLIARLLGIKKYEDAKKTHKIAILMGMMCSVFFMILSLFLPGIFMGIFTKDETVFQMGKGYLTIIMLFSMPMFIEIANSNSLQSSGNMKIPMLCQLAGACLNMGLDPLFIKAFGLGVNGAAIATVISQACAMIISVSYVLKGKSIFNYKYKGFRFEKNLVVGVVSVAIPTMIMNAITSITIFSMNTFYAVIFHSNTCITVLGVYYKLESFVFMPVFGLSQGTMPIMGYNYSANEEKRFKKTIKCSLAISSSIMTVGVLLFTFLPSVLLGMFDASDEVIKEGSFALRVISIHFILAAVGITISSMFQAIGHGVKSMAMSICRQIAFLLPALFILGQLFGVRYTWLCFAIAEAINIAIFIPIAIRTVKKIFSEKKAIVL